MVVTVRRVDDVSVAPDVTVALQDRFFRDLPELGVRWQAATFPDPRLLAFNEPLAGELGLDAAWLRGPDGLRFLVGELVPDGATPVAQAYAGHQFGGYVPRLGDGRALLLGELADADGRLRDIHLKGSGATPFARGGDGLAAVGPMLREYVISEAMHALGVPTTRSLAVRPPDVRCSARRRCPAPCSPASPPAICGWELPICLGHRRSRLAAPVGRSRDHPPLPRCRDDRSPLSGAVRVGRRRSGDPDSPVDADRLHPRRDEHRQHDDFRRDHRLRAVCLHGGIRPRHGVQFDRPLGPLRLRQPARRRGVEPRPVRRSPAPLLADNVDEGVALAEKAFGVFRARVRRDAGRLGCAPSSVCPWRSTLQRSAR